MTATWDEIRARSESPLSDGVTVVFCGDCSIAWAAYRQPCTAHATPEELVEIDAGISERLAVAGRRIRQWSDALRASGPGKEPPR